MKFVVTLVLAITLVVQCQGRIHSRYYKSVVDEFDAPLLSNTNPDPFHYWDQRVDHFDPTNTATWKQRYLVNSTFWGGDSYPIFFDLGGEGPLSPNAVAGRFILNELAATAHALIVSIEHRFYGKSIPTVDGKLSLESMKLLTTEQALADYASFISEYKRILNIPNSKIVSFGGSYSGMLSAWLRQKYPNIIHAAWASSAPVLAQLDFPEYLQVVTQSVGPQCAKAIKEGYDYIESMIQSGQTEALDKQYRTCSPIGYSEFDLASFVESVSSPICDSVQYGGDNNSRGRIWNETRICSILMQPGKTGKETLPELLKTWQDANGYECTGASYKEQIDDLGIIDPEVMDLSGRSWVWQTCTEYGYYQTGSSPFSKRNTLDYYLSMCQDVYKVAKQEIPANIDYKNTMYGGRKPGGSRIVFLNGSLDPWHALGIIEEKNSTPELPIIYIKGTAHCADLYASSPADLPSLTAARQKAFKTIMAWLKQN